MSINTEGYCIDHLLNGKRSEIGDAAVEQLKKTATETIQNCVDVYSSIFGAGDVGANGTGIVNNPYRGDIPNGSTGLIYGKIQSGKTLTTVATLAMAEANKFRCFIVLTSDNTWLGKQTADRFSVELEGGPVVFNWEQWRKSPGKFGKEEIAQYIRDTGVVLICTKNVRNLENLYEVLRSAKAQAAPGLIFDDEADNASLNTSEAKQAKSGRDAIEDSAIFELIGKIRRLISSHIYLQITATPQSLLLQNLNHPCRPSFCSISLPGNDYMGGDLFFEEDSPYCCTFPVEELEQLRGGEINPGNSWDNIPPKLRSALCCFFIGATYKMQLPEGRKAIYSFLAHICYKRVNHENLREVIRCFINDLDKALRDQLSQTKKEQAMRWLAEAYRELSKTTEGLPSLEKLVEELKHKLRNAMPEVINADNPNQEPRYKQGMNILIGGNRLGRGVTIEGLTVTYYGRDAKQKKMDTVHQHARMFGYRQKLLDVTRLFLPQHILEDFRAIHDSDEGMRQVIGDEPSKINITPVWVGEKLQATRANVLNPTAIDAFSPGRAVFPRDPLWKASEVKEHTEELNKLLFSFTDNDYYKEVNVNFLLEILKHLPSRYCSGERWEDKRVKQVFESMKAEGIQKGRLNVRRGKNNDGLNLTNQPDRPWQGSGFANSSWLRKPRDEYPDVPTLVMMYEKGEREKKWDNQPLYLPTLVLPKNKFVFMFNYLE